MPKWSDITKSEKYQNLPDERKLRVKRNFAIKHIVPNRDFQALDDKAQVKLLTKFGKISKADGVSKRHIRNTINAVANRIEAPPPGSEAELGIAIARSFFMVGDEAVEKTADVVAGKAKPTENTLASKVRTVGVEFPRFFAAEVLRFYKPSLVATAAVLGPVVGALGKVLSKGVGKIVPEAIKGPAKRFFLTERGNPLEFVQAKRAASLERSAGAREAQAAGEGLFVAQEDITVQLVGGGERVIKKGQILPKEQQRAMGKAFRKEFELGGKRPDLPIDPKPVTAIQFEIEQNVGVREFTKAQRIQKASEVNIAFNPKLKGLNAELKGVNKVLRGTESRVEGLKGKQFRTKTGFIEEAVEEGAIPTTDRFGNRISQATGELATRPGIVTRPVAPKTGNIPNDLLKKGESVLREITEVSKAKALVKPPAEGRKALLKQRRGLLEQIRKESMKIELSARANYQLFDRKFSEQIRGHPKFKQLSKMSQEGRDIMDKWSKELINSGIPSKRSQEIIEANTGEYMARMYEKKLIKDPLFFGNFKSLRLRVNGLRKRKQLSEEALRSLGIVNEPALATATRVREISISVANNKLFNIVAKNPEWTAATNATGKMVKMPDVKTLGPLRGKFVIKGIADDINSIVGGSKNIAFEMYGRGMAAFKFGKVVLNPATHMRNMITNTMLLDMSGTSHADQVVLFPQMMSDYIKKGDIYQRALKTGAIGGEFYGGDIKKIQEFYTHGSKSNIGNWFNTMKIPFQKAGNTYQAEEQLAKMVKFKDAIEKGASDKVAAEQAQKWLFNYTEIPDAIKIAKQVAPFITFTYKAIPRVVETGVNRPLNLYKYYAAFSAFNEASRKAQDMTPVEYAQELGALPPWMMRSIGGFPSTLMLPYRDRDGRTQFMNLEYILPLGMAPEVIERGIGRGGLAEAMGALVGNPYFTTLSDLISNKNFRGQDIVPFGSTKQEATTKTIEHLYQQLAPSLAPGIAGLKGGYSWEKLMDAVHKKKVKFEPDKVKRELTPTVMDILMGLKVTPVDLKRSTIFKMQQKQRDIRDLESQLFSALGEVELSEEDKAKMINGFFQKIQKVVND